MKNLNLSIPNYLKIGFLLIAIFSASFTQLKANSFDEESSFSKEELFNAIYFMDGNLVAEIPVLNTLKGYFTMERTSEDRRLQGEITQEVNNIDPSFMTRLHNTILSKDHYAISSILLEGSDLVTMGMVVSMDEKPEGFPNIAQYDLKVKSQFSTAVGKVNEYYYNLNRAYAGNTDEPGERAYIYVARYFTGPILLIANVMYYSEKSVADSGELAKIIKKDKSISHEKLVNNLSSLN